MRAGLLAVVFCFGAFAGRAQTVRYKELTYEFEKGGGFSWPEIVSTPNPQIRAALEAGMKQCFFGDTSVSFEELKRHARDKVNPLVAAHLSECENCESEHAIRLNEAYGVITLVCSEAGYCCGAHGYYGSVSGSFEVATGRTLRLDDLFAPGYPEVFTALGEQKIRMENQIPDEQTLAEYGYEGFAPGVVLADNWVINAGGISFIYNPYEVGPWAMPPPYFSLSFDEIRAYIRTDGPLASARSGVAPAAERMYRGSIDNKYKIVLCLTGAADLTGWYYYESRGENRKIVLTGTREGAEVVLTESVGGKITGTFFLSFSADGMQAKGIWKGSNGKLFPVNLTRN